MNRSRARREDITPAQLAKALGVTVRTVRRWYQNYGFIPPPNKASVPGSSGGPRASWPNREVTLQWGRQILDLKKLGATVEAIRDTILKNHIENHFSRVSGKVHSLLDDLLASPDAQAVVAESLVSRLSVVCGDEARAHEAATRYAADRVFMGMALTLTLAGFQSVCLVSLPSLALSVRPSISLGWLAAWEAASQTRTSGAAADIVVAFNVKPLVVSVAESLNEPEILEPFRSPMLGPAPLLWHRRDDGAANEIQLVGAWDSDQCVFNPEVRRYVPASEVAQFRVPQAERATP